jgi:hypothetical protein
MAKQKFDGVVEAVHYAADGRVDWVRAYERRGPIFSDHVLLPRQALVERLEAGKRFLVGKRQAYQGATFDVSQPVRLAQGVLVVGDNGHSQHTSQDHLEGVPII